MRRTNFTMIPNELIDSKIDPRALALYVYLARLKTPRPSYGAIMRSLSIRSKTTVKKLIDILVEEKWAEYIQGNEHVSNYYTLHWSRKCTTPSPSSVLPVVHEMDSFNTIKLKTTEEDKELMEWQLQKI